MSSLSMSQLGYFGYFGNGDSQSTLPVGSPVPLPAPAPPPPPPIPSPDPIGAYIRAKERMAELQASMAVFAPTTPTTVNISRPISIDAAPPPPVQVRMERTNGDLAKLALVGIISGLAVWGMTMRRGR